MNNFITFSTNKSYQEYAIVLVKSLRCVYGDKIVCRCVNCDESFKELLGSYDVIIIEDNIDLYKKKKFKNLIEIPILVEGSFYRGCMCNDEITYTCHSRFYNAKYIFDNYNANCVILVDCDFIIRSKFEELFHSQADLLIMDSVDFKHEDFIFLKNTIRSRAFLESVITTLEEDPFFWDQDTIALKIACSKTPDLKIEELDIKYKDFTLQNTSCIWSGDGHAKHTQKFKKIFNEILLA